MASLEVQALLGLGGNIVTLDLSQKEAVGAVLQALTDGGFVVLKAATNLNVPISQSIIVENKFVKAILTSAQDGEFLAHGYTHLAPDGAYRVVNGDKNWEKLVKDQRLMGVSCNHLGGEKNVEWVIEVDKGLRGKETNDMALVEATGLDIFLCNAWLRRSNPQPQVKPQDTVEMILVNYVWKGFFISSKDSALEQK